MAFKSIQAFAVACLASSATAIMSKAGYFYNTERPLVVAHRGSDSRFPEESIASLEDAYFQGADFLEFDLQITSDGYLVVQHDSDLNETSNVAEYADRFEDRKRDDGKFYIADFTLAELRLFKRTMRESWRSPMNNDHFEIITLEEVIEWTQMLSKDYPRRLNGDSKYPVGLYIELKDYTNNLAYTGYDMAEKMDEILTRYAINDVKGAEKKMPIVVQSFEEEALDKYKTLSDLPLVMLYGYHDTDPQWESFGKKFHGVGPDSQWVMNPNSLIDGPHSWDKSSATNTYSVFVETMHSYELAVHPYTLKDDSLKYRSNAYLETQLYVDNGVDGAFTEYCHTTFELFSGFGSAAAWPKNNNKKTLRRQNAFFLQ